MPDQPSSKSPKPAAGFSIDHEKTGQIEVPSITQLLNRKKLGLESESRPTPAAPMRQEIQVPQITPAKPQVRESRRSERRGPSRLEVWPDHPPSGQAASASAGLENAVRAFREASGAKWVVCLQPHSEFYAVHAVLGGGRSFWTLLTGFQWGQSSSPASYQALLAQGWEELTPHSSLGDARALRAALAVEVGLHLWIVGCGPRGQAPTRILMAAVPPGSAASRWLQANQAILQKI